MLEIEWALSFKYIYGIERQLPRLAVQLNVQKNYSIAGERVVYASLHNNLLTKFSVDNILSRCWPKILKLGHLFEKEKNVFHAEKQSCLHPPLR